jgi:hypothetical protein
VTVSLGRIRLVNERNCDVSTTMVIALQRPQWYDLLHYMAPHHQSEELSRDIEGRQRNIVFPDTVRNEARFWRNLGNPPFSTSAKVGLAFIVLFFFGTFGTWIVRIVLEDVQWKQELLTILLGLLFIFGPIFAAIVWATRRALRNSTHASKHPK